MSFYCKECVKYYSSKNSLYNHNKKFHCNKTNNGLENQTCKFCKKVLSNYSSKWRHEKCCKAKAKIEKENEIRNKVIEEKEIKNKIMEEKAKILEEKRILLEEKNKNCKTIKYKYNYIYLVQEREFIKTEENIFKIGMTRRPNLERVNQYPKGSDLLIQIRCIDCITLEKELITIFKDKFIQRKDIGNEYFEGDSEIMIDLINDYRKKQLCSQN
jgi:hypothetical protein